MVFLFLIIILISIIFTKFRIEIKHLRIWTDKTGLINNNYIAYFTILILGFIPIFKIKITKAKLQKTNIKNKMQNANVKNKINKKNIEILKIFIPKIKNINLKLQFGTENAAITAFIYTILKIILINLLKKDVEVEAVFNNRNQLNILVQGIFELNFRHIINRIYMYNKKRRVCINERTSNRRTYAYSNE